jgi:hypothetical protein
LTINKTEKVESREIEVAILVDVSSIAFQSDLGRRSAALDVAVFCGDDDRNVVGESWQRAEVTLSGENQRTSPGEFQLVVRVPVEALPRYIKAVVYERSQDKLGSAVLTLKQQRSR